MDISSVSVGTYLFVYLGCRYFFKDEMLEVELARAISQPWESRDQAPFRLRYDLSKPWVRIQTGRVTLDGCTRIMGLGPGWGGRGGSSETRAGIGGEHGRRVYSTFSGQCG